MNIYIGNIAYGMTVDEIKELFIPYGNVVNVRIITDRRTGKSKGYAFVEMDNEEDATNAIQALHDTLVKGRNIKVNSAHKKTTEEEAK
ncbi:MAG TPA: RNA-binding protein [Tenuifilaceae bacterium]|jgi:RNA recognition motif-containing protein|nr:RNA-binding protein [Bacteroidales bacterium]MDI9516014.1 RNA-binding protein [Bacteroidota bacterium]NLH55429.1 RNA-binding protein [Rikenellaceae bacterium]OQC64835.1 MAG: RNA recognition motif [Bacteroidetes bacterium ADurb.Bin008]HNV81732.1 RNA-binding protein [Tenuifilaceae bacterium]